jgi:hypothetical protein
MSGLDYGRASVQLVKLAAGNTVMRALFGVQADGFWTDNTPGGGQGGLKASITNYTAFGLVTTIGTGGETPPSPIVNPGDASPPAQRWLYNASFAMTLTDLSGTAQTHYLTSPKQFVNVETEGQVLAPAMPAGSTLNLWLTLDTAGGAWFTPTPGDIAWYSVWWSVLLKS